MKKIKSQADLKRFALASGAQVEINGGKFNTTMERVAKREPKVEEPKEPEAPLVVEPPPPPPPAPPVVLNEQPAPAACTQVEEVVHIHLDMDPVAQAIEAGNEKVVHAIVGQLRELQVPASPATPKSWTFVVKRDVRGFIESVDATPRL